MEGGTTALVQQVSSVSLSYIIKPSFVLSPTCRISSCLNTDVKHPVMWKHHIPAKSDLVAWQCCHNKRHGSLMCRERLSLSLSCSRSQVEATGGKDPMMNSHIKQVHKGSEASVTVWKHNASVAQIWKYFKFWCDMFVVITARCNTVTTWCHNVSNLDTILPTQNN